MKVWTRTELNIYLRQGCKAFPERVHLHVTFKLQSIVIEFSGLKLNGCFL
jgi:hypothetical protein